MDKPSHLYFHSDFFFDGFVINFPVSCIILRYSTCIIMSYAISMYVLAAVVCKLYLAHYCNTIESLLISTGTHLYGTAQCRLIHAHHIKDTSKSV